MRISDWSSDVCSSDLDQPGTIKRQRITRLPAINLVAPVEQDATHVHRMFGIAIGFGFDEGWPAAGARALDRLEHCCLHRDRKSTRLNSSHYCASRMPSSA